MARVADTFRFRAEAVRLNWPFIADNQGGQREHRSLEEREGTLRRHPRDLGLRQGARRALRAFHRVDA